MSDRLTFTIHEFVAVLDGYADVLLRAGHGVDFRTFHFLAVAADLQPVDITTLARRLLVTKAAVSKRVPDLVASGWLSTASDPAHGRRVLVSLTSRAEALVAVAGRELEAAFAETFDDERLRATGFDPAALNTQLNTLTDILHEKGVFS